jgi:uncharacterized iron-regulated membrane protein
MNLNVWNRKLHRWGGIAIALPVLIVIATGVLLQLKKNWTWVQPPERRGSSTAPTASFEEILAALRTVPEAEVTTWADVNRLDVRPSRGMIKVRAMNEWEVQLDATSAAVLQVAFRRSDIIESIHDGSFFHDRAKLWIFLPSGLILLGLWITGIYLFFLPVLARARKRRKAAAGEADRRQGERRALDRRSAGAA